MGGGRRNKSGSSSSSRNSRSHAQNQKQSLSNKQKKAIDDQLYQCMEEEVVSNKPGSTIAWKEWLLVLLVLIAILATCFLMGITAAITISVQYYQENNAVADRRITTMDNDINDVLQHLTQENVQELPPLYSEENDASKSNQTTQGIPMSEPTIHPSLCPDGITIGFSDWKTLKSAIHEANRLSAERFMKWNQWAAANHNQDTLQQLKDVSVSLYYEQDVFFSICPDITLSAKKGPIFINAENIVLECDGCTIQVGGSHLNFGPHAKNVLVRGITFRGAQTSSLLFYHDGCDAVFEDCYWYANAGNGKSGAVADVNSTSSVVFYRCDIDDSNNVARYSPRGGNQGLASSLSIRAS